MREADIETLLEEATTERMMRAGNVATELLVWIAMLGVLGEHKPDWMQVQAREGEAYSIWTAR
jgi:hypothetical protein